MTEDFDREEWLAKVQREREESNALDRALFANPRRERHRPPYLCRFCQRPLTARKLCWVCSIPERLWQEDGVWCVICWNSLGYLCGYVRCPDDHLFISLAYDEPAPVVNVIEEEMLVEEAMDNFGTIPTFLATHAEGGFEKFQRTPASQLRCHGGVTFSGPILWLDVPHGWWFGFDCGHAGDLRSLDHLKGRREREDYERERSFGGHVWTVEEVEWEVKRMAADLRKAWVGRSLAAAS